MIEEKRMSNKILTTEIKNVVENQIKMKKPQCTNEAYIRLQQEGCSKQEAKHLIGKVLEKHIRNMIMYQTTFNETSYANDLAKLSKTNTITTTELIYQGYDYFHDDNFDQCLKLWSSAWHEIKTAIKQSNQLKVTLEWLEILLDYEDTIKSWFDDFLTALCNNHGILQQKEFLNEVLTLFTCNNHELDHFKAAYGECLVFLKEDDQAYKWYNNWLEEDGSNYTCLESYLSSLIHQNKLDFAKELIDKYIDPEIECDFDTLSLFCTLTLYYTLTKDNKTHDLYQNKIDTFHNSFFKKDHHSTKQHVKKQARKKIRHKSKRKK